MVLDISAAAMRVRSLHLQRDRREARWGLQEVAREDGEPELDVSASEDDRVELVLASTMAEEAEAVR